MLEHHKKPLLSRREFLARQFKYLRFSLAILLFSIGIGILGYHIFGGLPWIDALLNASMILTGIYHRFLHKFHLDMKDSKDAD
jgi:hypothetical protein